MSNFSITSQQLDVTINNGIHSRSEADRTLFISPEPGYVVSKDNFVVPNPLPSNVASITLTDTGTPGEPENTVKVVVGIDPNYTATVNDNVITLGITGDADLYIKPPEGAQTTNVNAFVTISKSIKFCSVSITPESGITNSGDTFSGSVKAGFTNKLATYTITADSNNRFTTTPTIELETNLISEDDGLIFLEKTSTTTDAEGFITAFQFNLNYFSKVDYFEEQGLIYRITALASAIPTQTTNQFNKIDFGVNSVSNTGETRTVSVYGDVGAKMIYELKPTGGQVIDSGVVTIKQSGDYTSGKDKETFKIKFPPSSTSATYDLKFTRDANSGFNSSSIGSSPKTYTINQFANPTLTISATAPGGANYSSPASIATVGRANKLTKNLGHMKRTKFRFKLNYSITTTSSSISIAKVPEFNFKTLSGEVKSTHMNRVYLNSVKGLVTGMTVVENSNDNSLPNRTISSIDTTNKYVVVSSNFSAAGKFKNFSFIKSDWNAADVLPLLNGGSEISITNIEATANGQTATIKADVSIIKFGNVNKTIDLALTNILNES